MKKGILSLFVLFGICLAASPSYASKCRAWLYDSYNQRLGQYTNSNGCQEARDECLRDGQYRAPDGYCQDERGTIKYVNGGNGNFPNYCQVNLWVRGRFVTTFTDNCQIVYGKCANYVRATDPQAWQYNQYVCQ